MIRSRAESRGQIFNRVRTAVSRVERGEDFFEGSATSGEFGLSGRWEIAEFHLSRNSDPSTDRVPFEDDVEVEVMADDELRRIASRVAVRLETDSHQVRTRLPRNRNPRRDTLRRIRRLTREEQLLAGERLRREREDRNLRSRVRRQAEQAEVIRIPDHIWERWLNRHAA